MLCVCVWRSRGGRDHKGLDIRCSDGSVVYAPFDVTLNGALTVYTDPKKAAINSGINLAGEGGSSPVSGLIDHVIGYWWSYSCRSVLQAVLRQTRPHLRDGEQGQQDRRDAAHAERLPWNHLTRPRPDVWQEQPHGVLLSRSVDIITSRPHDNRWPLMLGEAMVVK